MKTTNRFLSAAISIALAFTISCSSDNDEGGVPFNENSQIYNENGSKYTGSGVIKMRYYNDNDIKIEWNAGNISDGIVSLDLPKDIPDQYFTDIVTDYERSFCTEYTEGIKIFSQFDLILTNSNIDIGTLSIHYEFESFGESILYAYFSKAGKITCNFEKDSRYSLNIAESGWNKVYVRGRVVSTNNILTRELKWLLMTDYKD